MLNSKTTERGGQPWASRFVALAVGMLQWHSRFNPTKTRGSHLSPKRGRAANEFGQLNLLMHGKNKPLNYVCQDHRLQPFYWLW